MYLVGLNHVNVCTSLIMEGNLFPLRKCVGSALLRLETLGRLKLMLTIGVSLPVLVTVLVSGHIVVPWMLTFTSYACTSSLKC